MTGQGIVVPTHLEQPIAECTRGFAAVHPPVDHVAATMLGQAAVMAVRMKECATLHDAAHHDRREAALADWDHRHRIGLDGVLAELIGAGSRLDPPPSVRDDDPASTVLTVDQWLVGLVDLRTRIDTALDAWNRAHPDGFDPDESDETRRSSCAGLAQGIDADNAPAWRDSVGREMRKLQEARLTIANGMRAAARERRYELAAQQGFVLIFTAFQRYQASQGVPTVRPEAQPAPTPPAPEQLPQVLHNWPLGGPAAEMASIGGEPSAEANRMAQAAHAAETGQDGPSAAAPTLISPLQGGRRPSNWCQTSVSSPLVGGERFAP